jgi:hypothetical protein
MYNTKIICTYNTSEIFLESDNITDDEKEFIREAVYRQELLNILNMEEYDEKEMDKAIHELYEKIKDNKELKECMLKLAGNFMSIDEEFGLMLMFAYDYMYLTHICISELLESNTISEKNLWKIKSVIF